MNRFVLTYDEASRFLISGGSFRDTSGDSFRDI
jgi:hypothetical protein